MQKKLGYAVCKDRYHLYAQHGRQISTDDLDTISSSNLFSSVNEIQKAMKSVQKYGETSLFNPVTICKENGTVYITKV